MLKVSIKDTRTTSMASLVYKSVNQYILKGPLRITSNFLIFFFFFEKKHLAPKDIDDPRERIFWSLQLFKINLSAQRKACDICGKENQAKMYFFS